MLNRSAFVSQLGSQAPLPPLKLTRDIRQFASVAMGRAACTHGCRRPGRPGRPSAWRRGWARGARMEGGGDGGHSVTGPREVMSRHADGHSLALSHVARPFGRDRRRPLPVPRGIIPWRGEGGRGGRGPGPQGPPWHRPPRPRCCRTAPTDPSSPSSPRGDRGAAEGGGDHRSRPPMI